MHSIEDAIANLRAAHRWRGSAKLIERTLIVLITGATEHLRLKSAHANAASPTPFHKFAEGKIVKR